jgi:hypothetical protein
VVCFVICSTELHTKQTPFADVNAFEIPMVVIRGDRPPIPKDMPKDYAKLMKSCWHKKASNRPPMNKIVKELTKIHKDQKLDAVAPSLDMSGERPFQLPVGGSTPNLLLHRIAPNLSRRSDSCSYIRSRAGFRVRGVTLLPFVLQRPRSEQLLWARMRVKTLRIAKSMTIATSTMQEDPEMERPRHRE